ncbi:uncharacterized protein [Spinacia oleracea]|uniref:DUF4283 domain-containing protein n=1 Tax=Spinacia oleracea TaxID=3562 RepID=A0A9R0K086_SPIOL|nr:uncharacterized protein LOC110792361 [Spinacia oleracea]
MKSGKSQHSTQVTPIPIFQSETHVDHIVAIEMEDIQDEVDYWNSAIVCVILGAIPPLSVIEGFFRRIWKDLGVDKVVTIEHGVFLVRFFTVENRDKVLNDNRPTFDKKPVICKPWHKDIVDFKDEVKVAPIWIQLKNLELKFWGNRSLSKIVSSVGRFIQEDQATVHRDKLHFARVQVEVALSQTLPDCLKFQDEHGMVKTISIWYEWKPTVCDHCKLLGHIASDCRKKKMKKKWVAKSTTTNNNTVSLTVNSREEFVQASNPVRVRVSPISHVRVTNSFQALEMQYNRTGVENVVGNTADDYYKKGYRVLLKYTL